MYTEQNKGFTVITNFGCDCHCGYWIYVVKFEFT